tara:strand:+ start:23 stop:658 length:636 start_codon:yes stop_codon:yes gene_type:complete
MASKIIVDQLEKTGGTLAALTLPSANATANQVLANDGAGALSWAAAGETSVVRKMYFSSKVDQQTLASTGLSWVGITDLTLTITPVDATSRFLIQYIVNFGVTQASDTGFATRLYKDGSFLAAAGGTVTGSRTSVTTTAEYGAADIYSGATTSAVYLDNHASASSVTYAIYGTGVSAGAVTAYINRGASDTDTAYMTHGISTLTVTELTAA